MRKFIIRYWFGIYSFKKHKIDRAAVWNMSLMLFAILIKVFVSNQTIALPLMVLPLSILIFNTFIYFRYSPVKWDELSRDQKHYYGLVYTVHFPEDQWPEDFKQHHKEWIKLDKEMKK